MKFGETFTEYLHGDQEQFLDKCSHVEYKQLKKVLKRCRTSCSSSNRDDDENSKIACSSSEANSDENNQVCQFGSCEVCDQKFFSELIKEASEIAGCFSSKVRRLLQLHISNGAQRYMLRLCHCFKNDKEFMVQEGRMLIEYVTMNAIAMRKILKKYDKVHSSINGRNFKTKLRAEHIELLQSPWLIELGAFYINSTISNGSEYGEPSSQFSCDLTSDRPVMKLTVSDSFKLEYSLTCAICLEPVFNSYALSCGHLFCKSCACSAASVLIFEGLKAAHSDSKCPVCREAGVYANAVHMVELDSLLKNRCKDYWKERLQAERSEAVKQSKMYWDSQTKFALGF
ncbi:RING-type E3 ubiquitin transferase [Ranunculus cassubicifolius]